MARLVRAALTQTARLIGMMFAVALAVSLVAGTFMLTDSIGTALHEATTPSVSSSTIVVRATAGLTDQANGLPEREPLPQSLLTQVGAIRGIQSLWTAVQGYAAMLNEHGTPEGMSLVGASWAPGDTLSTGRPPGADGVVIDPVTARRYHLHLGDRIRILLQGGAQDFTIAGLLGRTADVVGTTAATVIFQPATAARVLGQDAQIDEISLQARAGTSAAALQARINAVLPSRYEAVPEAQVAAEAAPSWATSLGFLPDALLLLAGVALIVGALLIWNTFSILVAQRTRQLGLLRAIGASRAQLRHLVLTEALAVGLGASLAGILIGVGAAHAMLAMARDVGLPASASPVVLRLHTLAAGIACGVTLTAVAALLPARRATRVSPVTALNGDESRTSGSPGRRAAVGVAAALAGVILLVAGASHSTPALLMTAFGVGLVLVGVALLLPLLARPAAWVISAPLVGLFGEPALLARQNVMRNPRRTAATVAALMISIGLVGVVTIVAASMRTSATSAVQQTLRADLVVTPASTSASPGSPVGVPAGVVQQLHHTAGVGVVSEIGAGQWDLAGAPETLLAIDPTTVTQMHVVDAASAAAVRRLDNTGVLVRDTVAEHHGWKVGDVIPMTFARTGTRRIPIEGIFSSTEVRADYVISLNALAANYADPVILEIDVKFVAHMAPAAAQTDIRRALAGVPVIQVMDHSQLTRTAQNQIDKLLTPLVALLGLSVLIGLLGIGNALALSIYERTREIGLLRSVGMARSQLRTMIRCEAVIMAGVGSVLGIGLAIGFGWAAVTALRHLGLTTMTLPVKQLGLMVALVAGAALLAAILPARRAAGLPVLDAVHHAG